MISLRTQGMQSPVKNTPVRFGEKWQKVDTGTLWGPFHHDVRMLQSGNKNCFFVAAFDALLHHPDGKELLNRIQVEFSEKKVRVKFPAQPWVTMPFKTLNSGVGSNYPGIVILEKAYQKLGHNMNEDSPEKALKLIFGKDCPEISFHHDARTTVIGADIHVQPNDDVFERGMRHYLDRAASDPTGIDVVTAIPHTPFNIRGSHKVFRTDHIYSVRLNRTTDDKFEIADPFDTGNSYQVSREWFPRVFNVGIVRVPRRTPASMVSALPVATSPTATSPADAGQPASESREIVSQTSEDKKAEALLMRRLFDPAVMPEVDKSLTEPVESNLPKGSPIDFRERIQKGRGLYSASLGLMFPPIKAKPRASSQPPNGRDDGLAEFLSYHVRKQFGKLQERLSGNDHS